MELNLPLAYAAVPYLITLAISVALSAAAYFLLKPKGTRAAHGNAQAEDFGLSNLSTQGAFVPLVIGRRRIGAVVAWVGDRKAVGQVASVADGGAKGSRGSKRKTVFTGQVNYQESAWHLLCVGPASKLHRIWSEGKLIYDPSVNPAYTPITPDTHPSGSAITTSAGVFYIYWGEEDQPVNQFLGDASFASVERVKIPSRWPHVCYVVWTGKWLGQTPHWPQIEYDIEVEAQVDGLGMDGAIAAVDPYYVDPTLPDPLYEGVNAAYALSQILFNSYPHGIGHPLADFDYDEGAGGGGGYLHSGQVSLNPFNADGTQTDSSFYQVNYLEAHVPTAGLTYEGTAVPPGYSGGGGTPSMNGIAVEVAAGTYSGDVQSLRVYLVGPSAQEIDLINVTGVGVLYSAGSINYPLPGNWQDILLPGVTYLWLPFETLSVPIDETGTWNIWVETETVFSDSPNNSFAPYLEALNMDEVSSAPSGSLYDLITLMNTEGQTCGVYAKDGEEAGTAVGTLLQDMGVLWTKMCDGREGFVPIRQVEDADVIALTDDQILPEEIEVEMVHAEKHVDKAIFSFPDAARNFRETTITIDEDGQPALTDAVRGQVLPIATVVNFDVASRVAERRSQEELAGGGRITINLARGGHRIKPGKVISVPGLDPVLRVVEVAHTDDHPLVEIQAILDHYGAPASTMADERPETPTAPPPSAAPEDNLEKTFFEVPEHVGIPGLVLLAPLRIRAHDQITLQVIHLSGDGSTYIDNVQDGSRHSGGELTSGLTATDDWEIATGPTFDIEGPATDLTDLFDDLTSDEAAWRRGVQGALIGEEIFFVKKVTALGGDSYRLDGLLRARYDTERAAHSIGDKVFLFKPDQITEVVDGLVYPNATVYMKQQPAAGSYLDLASVTAVNKTLKGKGVVPMRPGALRVTAPALGVPGYYTGNDVAFKWAYRSSQVPGTGCGMQPAGNAVGVSPPVGYFEIRVYDSTDTLVRVETVGWTSSTGLFGTYTDWVYANADLQSDLGGETDFRVEVANINGGYRSDPVSISVEKL